MLYDFLLLRSDYKSAAKAQLAYAWRLRAEGSTAGATEELALRAYGERGLGLGGGGGQGYGGPGRRREGGLDG